MVIFNSYVSLPEGKMDEWIGLFFGSNGEPESPEDEEVTKSGSSSFVQTAQPDKFHANVTGKTGVTLW